MSAFVWLDYSERERRKMLDVVDLFREHDTRDELGAILISQRKRKQTGYQRSILSLVLECWP